ncbi:hypothetical protein KUTeg_003826 [Tegillarca granosa]|uniref:Uncharacterized protein n=1 Tax=Tegillarca granosa TaxID=220873 RepID=A0ABQ9FSP1_TEGGR|nr:hypothetical protein KUTeg_003826 [Tegillarca granosa]
MYATGQQAEKLHVVLAETFMADRGVKRDITLARRKIAIQNADRQVTPKPLIPENTKKLRCLPYHLINAGSCINEHVVKDSCLCNLYFLTSKLFSFTLSSVFGDLNDFLNRREDEEICLLKQFFTACKVDLSQPSKLAVNLLSYVSIDPLHTSLKLLDQAREYLVSSNNPSVIPLYPGFTLHPDTSSALKMSWSGHTEIISYSTDTILLSDGAGRKDEESNDALTFYNITMKDHKTVYIPVNKNANIHLYGNRFIYISDDNIEIFDTEAEKNSSIPFGQLLSTYKTPLLPVYTTVSSDAALFAILFQNGDLLVFETSSMIKVASFLCGSIVEDINRVLFSNTDNLKVVVVGQTSTENTGTSSGFIKLFDLDHPNEQKYKIIANSFKKGLFQLSYSGNVIVWAVNVPNRSKIVFVNLDSLEECSFVNIGQKIVQLATSTAEDLSLVLTENGSLYVVENDGVIKMDLGTYDGVTCFGASWEQNCIFLGDRHGRISIYVEDKTK